MTDREKAVVMAYTGIAMLQGEKLSVFYKYIQDLLGRPVWTHELAMEAVSEEIKEKSKPDFLKLCAEEDASCAECVKLQCDPCEKKDYWKSEGYHEARRTYGRPSGEWIVTERGYECSECGTLHRDDDPFCRMCGTDMRKDNRLTKEQLENVWDSGYVKPDVEDWYEEGDST